MAFSLKDDILKKFGIETSLVEGHGGIFRVEIDGNVINPNQQNLCGGLSANDKILAQVSNYLENGIIEESLEKYKITPTGQAMS